MNFELYLIDKSDYLNHVHDKLRLYTMVKQLTHVVMHCPALSGNAHIVDLAKSFDDLSEELFRTWGIPKSYLITGNEEEIRNLLESELMPPDDMGYDFDTPHEGDDEPLSAEELTEELGKVLDTLFCEFFGNYRSVNIEVEL